MPEPPARWGDMRHHVFYGALYHWFLLFRNRDYRDFRRHREQSVATEAWLYTRRLLLMPAIVVERTLETARIRLGGWPYHLVLLQLEHDASFRMHGPFDRQEDFLRVVLDGFARGAPRHHHLVVKAHPLENGRSPLRRMIRAMAAERGLGGPGPLRRGRQARAAPRPRAHRRHRQLHGGAAGALAGHPAQGLRPRGLCQARVRRAAAHRRLLRPARAARTRAPTATTAASCSRPRRCRAGSTRRRGGGSSCGRSST